MKIPALAFLAALAGICFLAGCESMSERVHERFADVPPHVMVFDGDLKTVYYAAQTAFKQLDFNLTHSSLGTGRVEAASPIRTDPTLGDTRQLVAELHLEKFGDNQTQVSMLLRAQVQSDSFNHGEQQALREHGFYDTYFLTLTKVLAEQAGKSAKP